MSSTRITRRALSIVAITLLAAGTAAAAAGGALPMFESDDTVVVVETSDPNDVGVVDDGTDESDTTEESDDQATDTPVVVTIRANTNGDVDHHGKCTAWTSGASKSATNPAFAELQVSADAAGLTIDEYCATVLGTTDGDDDDDADDGDHGDGNSGKGNSGKGNSGKGNGSGNSDD